MNHDDRQKAADEAVEPEGYQPPKAEEIPSIEGPAVTSAGITPPG